jgi:regulatory protein
MPPKRRWRNPSTSSKDSTSDFPSSQDSEKNLYVFALKLLARRPFSVHEIRTKLAERSTNQSSISEVIEMLETSGYLNDRKYIESFLYSRARKAVGYSRIARELRTRGLQADLIREVLTELYPRDHEQRALIQAFENKARTILPPMDEKKTSRLYNHLVRKGFREEDIWRAIRARFGHLDDSS